MKTLRTVWRDPITQKVLALGLVAIAFGLRVASLDFQSLWRDEVDAILFAERSLPVLLDNFRKIGENGPLYFLALHYWIAVAGRTAFAVRFFALLAGVLSVPLLVVTGRRLGMDKAGWLAALLLTFAPYHVWYSQEAKMYSWVVLVTLIQVLLFLAAWQSGRIVPWLVYLAIAALSVYIHFFMALMIAVAGLWILLLIVLEKRLSRQLVWRIGLVIGFLAILYLPLARWQIPFLLTPAETGYYPYSLPEMVRILVVGFSLGFRPGPEFWPAGLYLVLTGISLVYAGVTRQTEGENPRRFAGLTLIWLVLPLILVYLISLSRPMFTDRYLILSLPAFLLLTAAGIVACGRHSRPIAVLLVVVLLFFSSRAIWDQGHNLYKADFRDAAAVITERAGANATIVYLMPYIHHAFQYYLPRSYRWIEPPYTNDGGKESDVHRDLTRKLIEAKEVWLVLSEADFWDQRGLVLAWFEQQGQPLYQASFPYVEVRQYLLPGR